MKKIILLLILFQASCVSAQFRYNRFGSRWVRQDNQCQINVQGGHNFLQQENEFLQPFRLGVKVMLQYQLKEANLVGAELGWSNAKLKKNQVTRILDESPNEYRSLASMTEGYESNIQLGANYSRILNAKRCFFKFTFHAGINWSQKRRFTIEVYDNTHSFTDYTRLITDGSQSNVSAYGQMDCLFGIPITRGAAIVFGPQVYMNTPTSMRNEFKEIRNGYLDYAEVEYSQSSILSLDVAIGIIFSLNQ